MGAVGASREVAVGRAGDNAEGQRVAVRVLPDERDGRLRVVQQADVSMLHHGRGVVDDEGGDERPALPSVTAGAGRRERRTGRVLTVQVHAVGRHQIIRRQLIGVPRQVGLAGGELEHQRGRVGRAVPLHVRDRPGNVAVVAEGRVAARAEEREAARPHRRRLHHLVSQSVSRMSRPACLSKPAITA